MPGFFIGKGVGVGLGVGVGFGAGWGFGGTPVNRWGIGAGGGMGLGFGLGWGWGIGWGSKIINNKQTFPRKGDNLLESAKDAAASALSALSPDHAKSSTDIR